MFSRHDNKTGQLEQVQNLELSINEGQQYGAEILVDSLGNFVYGSSRGTGEVLVYKLQHDDTLAKIQTYNLHGTWPRSMAIRDNLMAVIDQKGKSLQLLEIDPDTGMLSGHPDNIYPTPPSPAFVDFWKTSYGSNHSSGTSGGSKHGAGTSDGSNHGIGTSDGLDYDSGTSDGSKHGAGTSDGPNHAIIMFVLFKLCF